ncbi:MAG TPA: NERD domain-containing protein [Patescibacteria group bacterium]|nr:NERD domain-containing protein [Patescibacteria group bacterium]
MPSADTSDVAASRTTDAAARPAATADEDAAERAGRIAERLVEERVRAALPERDGYRVFANVAWTGRTSDRGQVGDGEADLVIAHPERGFLVIETKAGAIQRDASGRWYAGSRKLDPDPFEQATRSRHALVRKLADLPGRPADFDPLAGHAVALPDVDLASAGARVRFLGPSIVPELVLDHAALPPDEPAVTRAAIERAFDHWASDATSRRAPGRAGVELLADLLASPIELRSLLKSEIREGERLTVAMTAGQQQVLRGLARNRRMQILGAAGTGKTLLAAEKARRLASEGFDTLLVCFNQPLARLLGELTDATPATAGRLTVSTFHGLCEDLAREAGVLPSKPSPPGQAWFDATLPAALDAAIGILGARYHALVIDEGQDFAPAWLDSLQLLLHDPTGDVLYVFHDPAQAIFRDDSVERLGLMSYDLALNCRNPGPIHAYAAAHAPDSPPTTALREDGRAVERIEAAPGADTVAALRRVLGRLTVEEGVRSWEVAVLVGGSLEDSAVWAVPGHRYGNHVLWNGQVDDAGRTLGLAARDVPDEPPDVIVCDSIRRFKGLERAVVILCELKPDDPRLGRLLYVGGSRAKQHLVVIEPPAVLH